MTLNKEKTIVCRECGKKIRWIAEVVVYTLNNDDIEDFHTEVCYACLMDLENHDEVKKRMVIDENIKRQKSDGDE